MKKYFAFFASAALMMAACAKEEVNTPVETPVVGETEFISIELNPATRTILDGTNTNWSAGDAVGVYFSNELIGTLTLVEGSTNKFEGEIESALLVGQDNITLKYPADVKAVPTTQEAVESSFANGAALLEGSVKLKDLRAGVGTELKNMTALLQFKTPVAGDVAFTIGTTTYTVTGCAANTDYYACVDPANTGKLSYTVGIVLGANEKASFAPVANKVYNLGELTLKESMFGVIGNINAWGDNDDIKMYETAEDNLFVAYGVTVTNTAGFKVRKAGGWSDDYNFGTTATTSKSVNSTVGVYTDGGSNNIKVANGTYDIYFNRIKGQVYIMTPGKSYTEATSPTTNSTKYSIVGIPNWDTDVDLSYSGDNIWTLSYQFAANNAWKIRKDHGWNGDWGYSNLYPGSGLATNANGDIKMKSANTYIVSFISSKNKITLVIK